MIERIVNPGPSDEVEEKNENSLRPKSFNEYIGQKN